MRMVLLLAVVLTGGTALSQDTTADDHEKLGADLAKARRDLKVARTEFRRLARFEQTALRDARKVAFKRTAAGKAMAPAFGAAADLVAAAAHEEKDSRFRKLWTDVAKSFKALAQTLDKKESYLDDTLKAMTAAERAQLTFKRAEALLRAAADAKKGDEGTTSWALVKKGDPRYRAMAANMKAIRATQPLIEASCARASKIPARDHALVNASKLINLLQPNFDGVATERPKPPPALAPS